MQKQPNGLLFFGQVSTFNYGGMQINRESQLYRRVSKSASLGSWVFGYLGNWVFGLVG